MGVKKAPKILLIDIETQPDLVWAWGVYNQNAIAVERHWQMLSFSAKWIRGKKGHVTRGLPDYKGYKAGGDDHLLVKDVWGFIDEADIVIAHNGIDFDLKKLNSRFIVWGLDPPSPYKAVDTKRALTFVAGFSSNKLDWISQELGLGKKLAHEGWEMWKGCIEGDEKWWRKMKRYNRHDVTLLEELYVELSPWMRQPNMGLWSDKVVCPNPNCGSLNLESRGTYRSKTRSYSRFRCRDCGTWSRAVKSDKDGRASVVGLA